jgi:lactoylglutathione lyase
VINIFKRIDHVAIVVKDRNKSIQFYEEHLGFKKYSEQDVPVPAIEKIIYLKLGDTVLELIHMPSASLGQGFHFCLESDNFDEDYDRLKKAGIPINTEPHPAGAREPNEMDWKRVVFIGPDGEQIEFRGK